MNGTLYKILSLIKIISTNFYDFQIVTNPKNHVYFFNITNNITLI